MSVNQLDHFDLLRLLAEVSRNQLAAIIVLPVAIVTPD